MKIESGKRYVRRDGCITGPMERRTTNILYPWKCFDTEESYDADGYYSNPNDPCDLDLIALYEDEPEQKEQTMKFKVGDRVKYFSDPGLGVVKEVNPTSNFPFIVNWEDGSYGSYSNTARLELAQPEAAKEPLPGRLYRTRVGRKVLCVGKSIESWVYEEVLTETLLRYDLPFKYVDGISISDRDIVGEWTEETKLPAVEIKRWAVIFAKDTDEGKRGESFSIHTNIKSAQTFLDKLGVGKVNFEIVELTGMLPERMVSK